MKNINYVIDSVIILVESKEWINTLDGNTISDIIISKDIKKLKNYGSESSDSIIFIFTKEYKNRSTELKRIPSSVSMSNLDGRLYLKDSSTPYTGEFIDYHFTGKKYSQGTMLNGKLDGLSTVYHLNEVISQERQYVNGISEGTTKKYHKNGLIKELGDFINGREHGIWNVFYSNGQLKRLIQFQNGMMNGESITYYSTGIIKSKVDIKNGTVLQDDKKRQINKLYDRGYQSFIMGNYKSSIKQYSKCIGLDSTCAKAYFARGMSKFNTNKFEGAISDFDKTLAIEPLYTQAYSNRAISKIKKYQKGSVNLNSIAQEPASKENVNIPKEELERICQDLNRSFDLEYDVKDRLNIVLSLTDHSGLVKQVIEHFCN